MLILAFTMRRALLRVALEARRAGSSLGLGGGGGNIPGAHLPEAVA